MAEGSAAAGAALVTGAGGVVGEEVVRCLRTAGWDVQGVNRSGGEHVPWRMGDEPPPAAVVGPWDVIVHCAADTRWNLPDDAAWRANVASTGAVLDLVGAGTRLVHVSTAYAAGLRADGGSPDRADYRNSYEWSKAASERLVRARHEGAVVVRVPLVVGRRSDGHAARWTGLYTLCRAFPAGLLPVLAADAEASIDVVHVDDVAAALLAVAEDPRRAGTTVTLGGPSTSLTVGEAVGVVLSELNRWRSERAIEPLPNPVFVPRERWERFYVPFMRDEVAPLLMRAADLVGEFIPYLNMAECGAIDIHLDTSTDSLARTVRMWADRHGHQAAKTPRAWRARA